jgi:hypothetical protein
MSSFSKPCNHGRHDFVALSNSTILQPMFKKPSSANACGKNPFLRLAQNTPDNDNMVLFGKRRGMQVYKYNRASDVSCSYMIYLLPSLG